MVALRELCSRSGNGFALDRFGHPRRSARAISVDSADVLDMIHGAAAS